MPARDRDLGSDDEVASSSSSTAAQRHLPDKVLPDRAAEDADIGWGESPNGAKTDDWYERERPPHHEG